MLSDISLNVKMITTMTIMMMSMLILKLMLTMMLMLILILMLMLTAMMPMTTGSDYDAVSLFSNILSKKACKSQTTTALSTVCELNSRKRAYEHDYVLSYI